MLSQSETKFRTLSIYVLLENYPFTFHCLKSFSSFKFISNSFNRTGNYQFFNLHVWTTFRIEVFLKVSFRRDEYEFRIILLESSFVFLRISNTCRKTESKKTLELKLFIVSFFRQVVSGKNPRQFQSSSASFCKSKPI